MAVLAAPPRRLEHAGIGLTSPPRQLVLILTGRCNAACAYCFEAGRTEHGDLPWDVARRAIDVFLAPLPREALLSFTGGEPLLAFGLLRRCVRHARRRAAPGTALAIAVPTNGTRLPRHLVRFLAVANGPVASALERLRPSVVEAARTLGARGLDLARRIYLPLLRPGLLTAALLVLVEVMKEMPATLLLRPFGWDTLAVRIFEFTSEGEWQRAALPAVTLVLAGLGPVIWLARRSAATPGSA